MIPLFTILLVITSLILILLVLLHKGRGGGLSDMFGGGVSSTLGGSSVAERNLDRFTIGVGIIWFACIIALGLLMAYRADVLLTGIVAPATSSPGLGQGEARGWWWRKRDPR